MDTLLLLVVIFLSLYVWRLRQDLRKSDFVEVREIVREVPVSQKETPTTEELSFGEELNALEERQRLAIHTLMEQRARIIQELEDKHQTAIKILKRNHNERVEKLEAKIKDLKHEAKEEQKRREASQLHWQENDTRNVLNQIRFVSEEKFWTCSLMRKGEVSAFYAIENWVKKDKRNYRVFAQVCLGEYLKCESDEAHSSINSKRTDFLIIDNKGTPLIAIEYQGEGHYQENAEERDKVKQIAHEKAGVQVLELFPQNTHQDIHTLLNESLGVG